MNKRKETIMRIILEEFNYKLADESTLNKARVFVTSLLIRLYEISYYWADYVIIEPVGMEEGRMVIKGGNFFTTMLLEGYLVFDALQLDVICLDKGTYTYVNGELGFKPW